MIEGVGLIRFLFHHPEEEDTKMRVCVCLCSEHLQEILKYYCGYLLEYDDVSERAPSRVQWGDPLSDFVAPNFI